MGWPVGHSLSPALHNHWIAAAGLDAAYLPLAVRPEDFARALAAAPALGLRGVNVTIPHKRAAHEACASLDAAARAIGAVNTISFDAAGAAHGANTDAAGFLAALRQDAPDLALDGGPAVVIGAGGAARAILWALIEAGAPEIRLVNRSRDKAAALADHFGSERFGSDRFGKEKILLHPFADLRRALAGARLVVNATSLGMAGGPALDVDFAPMAAAAQAGAPPVAMDIVYRPLETAFLAKARAAGLIAIDGLGMLIEQARPGFQAWFGTPAPAGAAANRAARAHLAALLQESRP